MTSRLIDRRRMLRGAGIGAAGLGFSAWLPAWARTVSSGLIASLPTVSGDDITLRIARQTMMIDRHSSPAIGLNGSVPGPLVRLREGQNAKLTVINEMDEPSSIHWHGMLVPFQMDGVPGISFPGIAARSTFVYEFPVRQTGTYWYHSHTGLQEQLGHYGPIVVDPAGPDPIVSDREHILVLSDHSDMPPHMIFERLKQSDGYFDHQMQTLGGLLAGKDQSEAQRLKWGRMRMSPTDISDVTGATYYYLVNGHGVNDNWTALFTPGERVRLRIINASSMTHFNVRIPGLPLTIVQADGQDVRPVETDEFQIGVAETYDAIVLPADKAYTIVAEAMDRSGMARATLAPRAGMTAPVPPLRKRPLATMTDMGMAIGGGMSGMKGVDHGGKMGGMDMGAAQGGMAKGTMGGMGSMSMRDFSHAPGVTKGPGVRSIAPMPKDRMGDPGQGLEHVGHRVLVYTDLVAANRNPDTRAPSRAMTIHLTGNMERYMWSFDGKKLSEVKDPIPFRHNERVRITLVNNTMMSHPIHTHGHFFELVTGHGAYSPRKHTIVVQPGGTVTYDLTASAPGDWAFHCHLLYHMHAGMMQVLSVRPLEGKA